MAVEIKMATNMTNMLKKQIFTVKIKAKKIATAKANMVTRIQGYSQLSRNGAQHVGV